MHLFTGIIFNMLRRDIYCKKNLLCSSVNSSLSTIPIRLVPSTLQGILFNVKFNKIRLSSCCGQLCPCLVNIFLYNTTEFFCAKLEVDFPSQLCLFILKWMYKIRSSASWHWFENLRSIQIFYLNRQYVSCYLHLQC